MVRVLEKPRREARVVVAGGCELGCEALCGCTTGQPDDSALARAAARLDIVGGTADRAAVLSLVRRAREAGHRQIVVRTPAVAFDDAAARELAEAGAHAVRVPMLSHHPTAHDRLAARPDAMTRALVGMRALSGAGLDVEIEVPLLATKVTDPAEVVRLASRAVTRLRAVHPYVPKVGLPSTLAPPRWDAGGAERLAALVSAARASGADVVLRPGDGVPLCALRDHPDVEDAFAFDPRREAPQSEGVARGRVCDDCAARAQCAGVGAAYASAHGDGGLAPYARRPKALYAQRTTKPREWTDRQREAARRTWLVLRPTVSCNQDCVFCSANETSRNVWADPGVVQRRIARAGTRGVVRVCFTGGEPTITPHLLTYVKTAKRVGIPEIDLCTNAVLLSKMERVEALRDAGLTHAFVSLQAHTEDLSASLTLKRGDYSRTLSGIDNLLAAGVTVTLNHVMNARNYRYLTSFVETAHDRWAGVPLISFTMVTPQGGALDHPELVPRISEVVPFLKRAAWRALELGQPFFVGARQGIPPCFLGELEAWSDALGIVDEAVSEDASEKVRAPACDDCRYTERCTGLWRPYVERHGLGEIRPLRGQPLTAEQASLVIKGSPGATRFPRSFDEVPPSFRHPELEALGPPASSEPAPPSPVHLRVLADQRSRPVRIAMLGSGGQARRLARAASRRLAIDAVASPHAPDADLADFGGAPAFRDAIEALDETGPDGVIVAAATRAHAELALAGIARGLPVLVEKPVAETPQEAEDLVAAADSAGVAVLAGHNVLYADGIDVLDGELDRARVTYARQATSASPDAPATWLADSLYEVLYHVLVVVGRACGGGVAAVHRARFEGMDRPERIQLRLRYGDVDAEIELDNRAATEVTDVQIASSAGSVTTAWRRRGRDIEVTREGETRAVERTGSDVANMLDHFADVALGVAAPRTTLREAVEVKRTVLAALAALQAAGAPLTRPDAPRHAASAALRSRLTYPK